MMGIYKPIRKKKSTFVLSFRCWKPNAIRRVESFRFLLTTPSDLSIAFPSSQSSNDIEKGFLPEHSFASTCDT
jgi:hypothetical protein